MNVPRFCTVARLAVAWVGAALLACDTNSLQWREEVRLQSGETIIVERTARLKINSIAGGGGGLINQGMTVEIVQPNKVDNPTAWNARFVPLAFDRDPESNEWFIVATFYHCDSWYELGRPVLPYTEYRFRNGQWVQQQLSPKRFGLAANMLTDIRPSERKDWTVEEKISRLNDPMIPRKFKSVTSHWQSGC